LDLFHPFQCKRIERGASHTVIWSTWQVNTSTDFFQLTANLSLLAGHRCYHALRSLRPDYPHPFFAAASSSAGDGFTGKRIRRDSPSWPGRVRSCKDASGGPVLPRQRRSLGFVVGTSNSLPVMIPPSTATSAASTRSSECRRRRTLSATTHLLVELTAHISTRPFQHRQQRGHLRKPRGCAQTRQSTLPVAAARSSARADGVKSAPSRRSLHLATVPAR